MRHRFRLHQQHLLSVPPAVRSRSRKPAPHRGSGRPVRLTFVAAGGALAAAAVAAGVVAGPPAPAMALAAHVRSVRDVTPAGLAAHGAAGPFLGSAAKTWRAPASDIAARWHGGQPGAGSGVSLQSPGHRRRAGDAPQPEAGKSGVTPGPSATAGPSASAAQAAPTEQPITIYDSVQPGSIPAGVMAATYATGKFAVPAAEMAGRPTIWIDAWGTDPGASVLDVEPGDATPAIAAAWVAQKLTADHSARARIYTMLAEWPAVQSAIATLPAWMQAHVRYWIADPTGVPHMVSGASATQWYWGSSYDISTANPGF